MNIKTLFNQGENITIESYLTKCGVKDVDKYLKPNGSYIEPFYNYDNINYLATEIKYWSQMEDSLIFIIQDGDTDGICSTMELYNYLQSVECKCKVKILIHDGKERGLDDEKIMDRIRSDRPNFVIIPDAGTNNKSQAHELTEIGIGLGVVDHHDITDPITNGYLVTNQSDKTDRNGSGAVVTHKLLQALDKEFNAHYSQNYIDLVALSIISDSMNVTSMQNREYLYWGMFKSRDCIKNNFLNVLFDRFIGDKEYTQRDISFKIVPKLNSAIRTKDINLKQRILLAFMDRDNLDEVCSLCEQAHKNQIETVATFIDRNIDKINKDDNVIILATEEIPRSYSGLIAGRLSNECEGKPTIVGKIKNGFMIGSLRSPIPLRTTLDSLDLVEWASGHEEASGICVKEENIEPLTEYLNTLNLSYTPCIDVLQSFMVNRIPNQLFFEFDHYNALWSNSGLPKPTFHIKGIKLSNQDIKILGQNKRTLKFTNNGIDFLIFNCLREDKINLKLGDYENDTFVYNNKNKNLSLEIVGTLSTNEWNGKKQYQCIIEQYEIIDKSKMSVDDLF